MDLANIEQSVSDRQKIKFMLLRRLVDAVAMPTSQIPMQDRSLVSDILISLLLELGDDERLLCAERLKDSSEAPRRLLRYLAQSNFNVAEHLLNENTSFNASDLVELVHTTSPQHRMAIAQRREVDVSVCDALIDHGEVNILEAMLRNRYAQISELGMDALLLQSRAHNQLCPLIAGRPELRPAQAMAMFWWSGQETRKSLLLKNSADRKIIMDYCSDVFPILTKNDLESPLIRKILNMIDRRQRNRKANEVSSYDTLEQIASEAAKSGLSPDIIDNLGYFSNINGATLSKLLVDSGGEGIAVFCKATGLSRNSLIELWQAVHKEAFIDKGELHPHLSYIIEIYDLMTSVKAQTALRYWNWSFGNRIEYL